MPKQIKHQRQKGNSLKLYRMINKLDWRSFGVPLFCAKPKDKSLYPCLLPRRIQVPSCLHEPTQTWKPHHCPSRGWGRSPFLSTNLPLISRKGSSSSDISLSLQYWRKRPWFPRSSPLFHWSLPEFAWPASSWPRLRHREHSHISRKSPHCDFAFVACVS